MLTYLYDTLRPIQKSIQFAKVFLDFKAFHLYNISIKPIQKGVFNLQNYYTISDLTHRLITKYEIEDNENNFKAVRTKVVRTLKELKINVLKKDQTGFISQSDCLTIEYRITNYLLKRSSMTEERREQYRKYVDDYYKGEEARQKYDDELASMTQAERYEKERQDELEYIKPVSEDQITRAMIKALFNLFFTPIDIEQWNKDHELLQSIFYHSTDDEDFTDIETFRALERYNNPHMYYTKKRERPLI